MKKPRKIQCALGAFAALCAAPAAWAITPPGTPPTFYCDADRPANADTVEAQLNTRAVSASEADRGNQPRWEAAIGASGFPNPLPSTVPSNLTFGYLSGTEIANYVGGLSAPNSLAQVGF